MNWIPKNLKELGKLADQLNAEKHPLLPPHVLVKKRFKDTTANELTKTIIWDMYHVRQGVAYRINNGAVYDVKKKVYRKGVQRKGVPDITTTGFDLETPETCHHRTCHHRIFDKK